MLCASLLTKKCVAWVRRMRRLVLADPFRDMIPTSHDHLCALVSEYRCTLFEQRRPYRSATSPWLNPDLQDPSFQGTHPLPGREQNFSHTPDPDFNHIKRVDKAPALLFSSDYHHCIFHGFYWIWIPISGISSLDQYIQDKSYVEGI